MVPSSHRGSKIATSEGGTARAEARAAGMHLLEMLAEYTGSTLGSALGVGGEEDEDARTRPRLGRRQPH